MFALAKIPATLLNIPHSLLLFSLHSAGSLQRQRCFFVFCFFFKVRSRQGGAEADRLSRVGLRGSEVRVTHRLNDCDCEQDTKLATP